MGRARFIIYPWFIFYVSSFLCHHTQTSTRPTLNHAICYVIQEKLSKQKYTDNVTQIVSLLWVKQFFVWFYLSVGFEEENKYAKVLRQPWNAITLQLSLSRRDR